MQRYEKVSPKIAIFAAQFLNMMTKQYYTAPKTVLDEMAIERPFALSYNETDRTENMAWDNDEVDL